MDIDYRESREYESFKNVKCGEVFLSNYNCAYTNDYKLWISLGEDITISDSIHKIPRMNAVCLDNGSYEYFCPNDEVLIPNETDFKVEY